MGKIPKPLVIYVHIDYKIAPWVEELRTKGHIVCTLGEPGDASSVLGADLILGPNCARFLPGMEKFLDSFIAGARKVRYPGKKKDD